MKSLHSIAFERAVNKLASWAGYEKRFVFPAEKFWSSVGLFDQHEPTENAQRNRYRGMFFRAVNIRAQKFAEGLLASNVVRIVGQNEYEEVEPDHPWVQLKDNPCPHMNAVDYWKWVFLSIDLIGHARSVVRNRQNIMGAQQPEGYLPIYQAFGDLDPIPNSEGGIDAWKFWRADGKVDRFDHEDVLNISRYSPFDPYQTISLVQAAIYELDVDLYMKEYRKKSVNDGGLSSVVLGSDQDVRKDVRDRLAQDFKDYMGTRGIDKALALSHGFKPINFGMDARDLQFIEGNAQTKDDIFDITGVPEALFSKDANRANIFGAQLIFADLTLNPGLKSYCSQLTSELEKAFDAEKGILKVLPEDMTPMDEEMELRKQEMWLRNGVTTENEIRRNEGLEELPHEYSDIPKISMSQVPITDFERADELREEMDDDQFEPNEDEEQEEELEDRKNGAGWPL